MGDPFANTRSKQQDEKNEGGAGYIREFYFNEATPIPVQIMELGERFNHTFPIVRRHWPKYFNTQYQQEKNRPPILCTSGFESTKGKCLCCHLKTMNLIKCDVGQGGNGDRGPSEDTAIPMFDHGRYKKNPQSGRFEPLRSDIPLIDGGKDTLIGGLKLAFLTTGQFKKLLTEHDNVQNECAAPGCNGNMMVESLNCESCTAPAFEVQQLQQFTKEQFLHVRFTPYKCQVCNHEGVLDVHRGCVKCKGNVSKRIFDVVVMATQSKVAYNKRDGTTGYKSEYDFAQARGRDIVLPPKDTMEDFYSRMWAILKEGPSIQQQAQLLETQVPTEWLAELGISTQGARPYGA